MSFSVAAIDIGSNAIRMVIGNIEAGGKVRLIKKIREPVRLGHDVFTKGSISTETFERTLRAFDKFARLIKKNAVSKTKIVATSAMREASNSDELIRKIDKLHGLKIEVINGELEGQLIHLAVCRELLLLNTPVMMVDIGGGSVEISFSQSGKLLTTKSFPLGTVRLLEKIEKLKIKKDEKLTVFIDGELAEAKKFLDKNLPIHKPEYAIGTGGNLEAMGRLKLQILKKTPNTLIQQKELEDISKHLENLTIEDRIKKLDMRKDRADVIMPATLVVLGILSYSKMDKLVIPYVGLRDGILWTMIPSN